MAKIEKDVFCGSADVAVTGQGATRRMLALIIALIFGQLLSFVSTASAQTTVEAGDVLRISVLEDAALGRDAAVGIDGTIMLPQIGEITVAGEDLSGIRALIETALQDQEIIRVATVIVEMAEYRPLYVGGAVASPGAIPFKPGLRARHAIILAGGIDTTSGRDRSSPAQIAEMLARLQFSAYELMQVESHIARLELELQGENFMVVTPGPDSSATLVPVEDSQALFDLDSSLHGTRVEARDAEKEFLLSSLSLIDTEIGILELQAEIQEEEQGLQREEVENARVLVERGLKARPALQELERELSRLSRDLLENQSFTARARQDRVATMHELQSVNTEREIEIRHELRNALRERARITSDIEGMRAWVIDLGLLVNRNGSAVKPDPTVVIHRNDGSVPLVMRAELEEVLLPGDVLEIILEASTDG